MVDLNAEGIGSAYEIGGEFLNIPGKYHCVIESAEEATTKEGGEKVVVTFLVLNGTTPGQQGKKFTEHFACSEKAMSRLLRLAMVIGLLQHNERKAVNFEEGVGRDLIVETDTHEYQGKKYCRATYAGFWTVGHAEVASVPIDRKSLEVYRKGIKQQAAAAVTQAAAESDAFDNL